MFFLKKLCYSIYGVEEKIAEDSLFRIKFFRVINKMKVLGLNNKKKAQKGFSVIELLIVLIILSILAVLALPQIIASRRVFRFSGMQRQFVSSLTEARQSAMTQRTPVTFRYDNANKRTIIYGGAFGAVGNSKNRVVDMSGSGLVRGDIVYGRPTGASTAALGDSSNMTALASGVVEVTFQPDGSVIDASNNPKNNGLFFYHKKNANDTAFAVSILGAGGRIKIWRYSKGPKVYVE